MSINVALDSDFQPNGAQALAPTAPTPDSISEVTFDLSVSNPTDKALSLLTIPTGIKQGTLNYIRVTGATGYEWQNGELVIEYVSLPPHGSAIVTVTGLPLISTDDVVIDIAPKVKDKDGVVIAQDKPLQKIVAGKHADLVAGFHSAWKKDREGGQANTLGVPGSMASTTDTSPIETTTTSSIISTANSDAAQ